jgi:hypothetical protein
VRPYQKKKGRERERQTDRQRQTERERERENKDLKYQSRFGNVLLLSIFMGPKMGFLEEIKFMVCCKKKVSNYVQ